MASAAFKVIKVFGSEQPERERFEEHDSRVRDQECAIFVKVSRFVPTIDYIVQANIGVLLLRRLASRIRPCRTAT